MNSEARVAVVYHSVTGTTARLAEAALSGASRVDGIEAFSVCLEGADMEAGRYRNSGVLEALSRADAIIFGSPTFMGSVSAQFKAFADATSEFWFQRRWAGKFAAGFTVGNNPSGDQLSTIQYLSVFANQHGMLWVGIDLPGGFDAAGRNRMGAQSGLIAHAPAGVIEGVDLETARYLGSRVASVARQYHLGASRLGCADVAI
ncbi:MAG: flavodoxin family protein [Pseudohaliea sp.]